MTREMIEVTKETQMVLSCIKRMGENYGKQMLMKVLAGSKEQKLQNLGFATFIYVRSDEKPIAKKKSCS